MVNRKKQEIKVTVVIPTFNRSHYVVKAIDSCLEQTSPCKIIVCDHGSKDDTPKVVEKYGNKIKYVRKEEDFGPHFCWLDGVLHSDTEFVKLLFDDDWIEPTFVEKTSALMKEDVSCVITNAKTSHEINGRIGKINWFKETGIYKKSLVEKKILLGFGVKSPTCCLFRRQELIDGIYQGKLFKKGGNYYHGVGPDIFIMLLGFLRYPKIGLVAENLAIFRAHDTSITIDAIGDNIKRNALENAYSDVIEFYSFLKYFKIFKGIYFISSSRISRKYKLYRFSTLNFKEIKNKFLSKIT